MRVNFDKTPLLLLAAQTVLIGLFWIFATYDTKYKAKEKYPSKYS